MEKSVKSMNECFSEGVNELTSFSKRKDSKKKKEKKKRKGCRSKESALTISKTQTEYNLTNSDYFKEKHPKAPSDKGVKRKTKRSL